MPTSSLICSKASPDLCIGYSTDLPELLGPLQLKSRLGLATRNKTSVQWAFGSVNYENITLAPARFAMGGRSEELVVLVNISNAKAFFNTANGTVQRNGNLCITPMQCNSRGRLFCDPSSTDVAKPGKLRRGAFLKWRKCSPGAQNQRFSVDSDCAPECSFVDQVGQSCKPECATSRYCLLTGNYSCPPPNDTTSNHPTTNPSAMPTLAPTGNPATTTTTTAVPSTQPTGSPTASQNPTSSPTAVTTLTPTPGPTVDTRPPLTTTSPSTTQGASTISPTCDCGGGGGGGGGGVVSAAPTSPAPTCNNDIVLLALAITFGCLFVIFFLLFTALARGVRMFKNFRYCCCLKPPPPPVILPPVPEHVLEQPRPKDEPDATTAAL